MSPVVRAVADTPFDDAERNVNPQGLTTDRELVLRGRDFPEFATHPPSFTPNAFRCIGVSWQGLDKSRLVPVSSIRLESAVMEHVAIEVLLQGSVRVIGGGSLADIGHSLIIYVITILLVNKNITTRGVILERYQVLVLISLQSSVVYSKP